jgi:hypothetical protein
VAFDADATESLNKAAPIQLWIDAARNPAVPASLQGQIAQAGWVRAVLLNDAVAAKALAQRTAELTPELRAEMRDYLAKGDPAEARFAAIFLMLRGPGFTPVIRPGFPREAGILERDMLRDNWWHFDGPSGYRDPEPGNHEALYDLYPDGKFIPPDFLPKDQRAAGEAEWHKLIERAGNSVNYLCAETIAWAKSHPQDPRVPQALHEAVIATRYGPYDARSGYSKQAFDLLHRNYPNSEWTRQTKYWY